MRKITKLAVMAFENNKNFSQDNTTVKVSGNLVEMYLHGNRIAWKDSSGLYVCDCGWKTTTTKERLNGILSTIKKGIYQRAGEWFFNDGGFFPTKTVIKVH